MDLLVPLPGVIDYHKLDLAATGTFLQQNGQQLGVVPGTVRTPSGEDLVEDERRVGAAGGKGKVRRGSLRLKTSFATA